MPRPKGLPKTGGRRVGTPNKVNATTRARIEREADPIGFLTRVLKGEEIDGRRPTLEHRIDVATKLLNKIAPDVKALAVAADGALKVGRQGASAGGARERLLARFSRMAEERGAVAPLGPIERPLEIGAASGERRALPSECDQAAVGSGLLEVGNRR